jgi:hypothetical protein
VKKNFAIVAPLRPILPSLLYQFAYGYYDCGGKRFNAVTSKRLQALFFSTQEKSMSYFRVGPIFVTISLSSTAPTLIRNQFSHIHLNHPRNFTLPAVEWSASACFEEFVDRQAVNKTTVTQLRLQ